MAYCTTSDVESALPFFQTNQPGSVQDSQIQGWIDDRKSRIRAVLLARGIDPDTMLLTADQANWLRALNRDGAISDLYLALESTNSLQPGEAAVAKRHADEYAQVMKDLLAGLYDKLFSSLAKTTDIKPGFGGTAGGETDTSTPEDRGENRSFGKDDVY